MDEKPQSFDLGGIEPSRRGGPPAVLLGVLTLVGVFFSLFALWVIYEVFVA